MNQVTVDIEQYLATGQFGSHMAIPYFSKSVFPIVIPIFSTKGGIIERLHRASSPIGQNVTPFLWRGKKELLLGINY